MQERPTQRAANHNQKNIGFFSKFCFSLSCVFTLILEIILAIFKHNSHHAQQGELTIAQNEAAFLESSHGSLIDLLFNYFGNVTYFFPLVIIFIAYKLFIKKIDFKHPDFFILACFVLGFNLLTLGLTALFSAMAASDNAPGGVLGDFFNLTLTKHLPIHMATIIPVLVSFVGLLLLTGKGPFWYCDAIGNLVTGNFRRKDNKEEKEETTEKSVEQPANQGFKAKSFNFDKNLNQKAEPKFGERENKDENLDLNLASNHVPVFGERKNIYKDKVESENEFRRGTQPIPTENNQERIEPNFGDSSSGYESVDNSYQENSYQNTQSPKVEFKQNNSNYQNSNSQRTEFGQNNTSYQGSNSSRIEFRQNNSSYQSSTKTEFRQNNSSYPSSNSSNNEFRQNSTNYQNSLGQNSIDSSSTKITSSKANTQFASNNAKPTNASSTKITGSGSVNTSITRHNLVEDNANLQKNNAPTTTIITTSYISNKNKQDENSAQKDGNSTVIYRGSSNTVDSLQNIVNPNRRPTNVSTVITRTTGVMPVNPNAKHNLPDEKLETVEDENVIEFSSLNEVEEKSKEISVDNLTSAFVPQAPTMPLAPQASQNKPMPKKDENKLTEVKAPISEANTDLSGLSRGVISASDVQDKKEQPQLQNETKQETQNAIIIPPVVNSNNTQTYQEQNRVENGVNANQQTVLKAQPVEQSSAPVNNNTQSSYNVESNTSPVNSPLNQGHTQSAPVNTPSNQGYTQNAQVNIASNQGYTQSAPVNTPSNQGYTQSEQVNASFNQANMQAKQAQEESSTPYIMTHEPPKNPITSMPTVTYARSTETSPKTDYGFWRPAFNLLARSEATGGISDDEVFEKVDVINSFMKDFSIRAEVADFQTGPVITRFLMKLESGVRANSVINISTDLKRVLMGRNINMITSVPGTPYMGIEVPNKHRQLITLGDLIENDEFTQTKAKLPMVLGVDTVGKTVVVDLAEAPHLLIAGTTGSGKSAGLNAMLVSLLLSRSPEEMRLIMVDPKTVEFTQYQGLPHLLTPIITDPESTVAALGWLVREQERRYKLISLMGVSNIAQCNDKIRKANAQGQVIYDPAWTADMGGEPPVLKPIPYIVLVIDEFADLMAVAGGTKKGDKSPEALIGRITAKARAAGINLILATQSPRADVVTGVIKANMPSRIAYTVQSNMDSRVILDEGGAENLLGNGDMMVKYQKLNSSQTFRAHGPFASVQDVQNVVNAWKDRFGDPEYIEDVTVEEEFADVADSQDTADVGRQGKLDVMFDRAVSYIRESREDNSRPVSITEFQSELGLGFPRAKRLRKQLISEGIIDAKGNIL